MTLVRALALTTGMLLSASLAAHASCQPFHAGNSETALNFCVTENGNIASLNSGMPLITDGAEGYALCGGDPQYWDLGAWGDSGNWEGAVITQPNGPGTFPFSIYRASSDAHVAITQAFTLGTGGRSVHVKMTVDGGPYVTRVYRWAHVEGSNGDHSTRTAFIWTSGGFGLTASPILTPRVSAGLAPGSQPANPCVPTAVPSLPYAGDSALLLAWSVAANRKASVSFDYVPIR